MGTIPDSRGLSPSHLDELAKSGIPPELATQAGLYTETDPYRAKTLLNWERSPKGFGPCLVIPYHDKNGQPTGYNRIKPTHPRTGKKKAGKDGKPEVDPID